MSSLLGTESKPQTILIVEDEILIRMVIADYLRHCGFKVIEAAHGDEALFLLQQPDVDIDLVFSDIEMPGAIDGFTLYRWVRDNRPGLPVILTGNAPKAAEAAAELCDTGGSLPKPYDSQVALDRIRRLLALREQNRKPGSSKPSLAAALTAPH